MATRTNSMLGALPIFLIAFVAYLPAIEAQYIWDDDAYVQRNSLLSSADGLRDIWTKPTASPQYYPLVFTSFWIEQKVWGTDPTGYHIVNIVLHALSATLLWRILLHLRLPGAWFAAAVFAVHPVHVESVAWISERKNTLSAYFYLSATLLFVRQEFSRDTVLPVAVHFSLETGLFLSVRF